MNSIPHFQGRNKARKIQTKKTVETRELIELRLKSIKNKKTTQSSSLIFKICSIEHGLSTWQKQKSSLKSESLILAGQNVYRLGGKPKIVQKF